ncbi:hypothetical protein BRC97_00040 [Halobacteriales archaeon QS_6_71_20]|nr:MAG: hypothetical protein BRC97_00040 [Halobacteriales archaeon QS_6_71_20]
MSRSRPDRVAARSGVVTVVAAFGGIAFAVALAPWFSVRANALSELGVADAAAVAWAFNGGLLAAGAAALPYGWALWTTAGDRAGRLVALLFCVAVALARGRGAPRRPVVALGRRRPARAGAGGPRTRRRRAAVGVGARGIARRAVARFGPPMRQPRVDGTLTASRPALVAGRRPTQAYSSVKRFTASSVPPTTSVSPATTLVSGPTVVRRSPSRSTATTVQPVRARTSASATVSPTSSGASVRTRSTCVSGRSTSSSSRCEASRRPETVDSDST